MDTAGNVPYNYCQKETWSNQEKIWLHLVLVAAFFLLLPLVEKISIEGITVYNPFSEVNAYYCLLGSLLLGAAAWIHLETSASKWSAVFMIVAFIAVLVVPSLICHSGLITIICAVTFVLLGLWALFVLQELKVIE